MTENQAIEHCRKKLKRIAPDPAEGLIIETGTVKNDRAEWSITFTYLSGVWEPTKVEKIS